MGADVSRVRFDPLRDFAGVVLQQGRLLLDADFNEYVALLDRRLRAETSDLTSFGPDPDHAGVAWVPRQTPDAFRVTASGGELTIGRGRMYVDGLLAENHGLAARRVRPAARRADGHGRHALRRSSRTGRTPDALPVRRAAPRLPRRLAARGHPPGGPGPRRGGGRRRHDRPLADRLAGPAAARTRRRRLRLRTTTRSPAGST